MNPFLYFLGFLGLMLLAMLWLLRTIDFGDALKAHAQTWFMAYVKGATLVAIAVFTAFDEVFRALKGDDLPWYLWACVFIKPTVAGLTVLAAFLDRSLAAHAPLPPPVPPVAHPDPFGKIPETKP